MSKHVETPTSSTHSHGLKRKNLESTDTCGSDEIPPSPSEVKRIASESSSYESPGTPTTTSKTPIQEWTSDWSEDTLNSLQISSKKLSLLSVTKIFSDYFLPSVTPFIFLSDGIELSFTPLSAESMINNCIDFLNIDSSPLKRLDVDDISDIDCALAYSLMFMKPDQKIFTQQKGLKRQIKSWIPGTAGNGADVAYQNWFCQMFYTHGQRFTQQLIRMCLLQKKKEKLKASMFESLFQEFAGMFGLLSFKQDNGTKMKIGKTQVTAKPNIVFPYFKESDEEDISPLALCEVKCECEEKDMDSPKQTRAGKQRSTMVAKHIRHLDDRLLGQHGGELLVHLPFTQKNSLLGIVVQRTNVTFSHLRCTEDQLDKIQSGKATEALDIVYSRPYNYLKEDDRNELIKALLTLGVIQLTPYVK